MSISASFAKRRTFENQNDVVRNYVAENHMTAKYGWHAGSRSRGEAGRYQSRGLPSFLVANLTHPRGAGHGGEIISRKDYLRQPSPNCPLFARGGSGDTSLGSKINIIFVFIATARSQVAIVCSEAKTQTALSDKTTAIRKRKTQHVSSRFSSSLT